MREGLLRLVTVAAITLLWALPAAGSVILFAWSAADLSAWQALLQHPQVPQAAALSVWTGLAGLALSLAFALLITLAYPRPAAFSVAGLAIPHLAFSIGLGFLIMPSGLIARVFVGGDSPPQWVSTQDPWGLSLIACLALKETPFLLAMIWSYLARADVRVSLAGQTRAARSLGHGTGSLWLRVLLPQILPRLIWPLIIIWVYGATVVDMALVIGPTQPPTLSLIIWADLNNADAALNARGVAGASLLSLIVAGIAGLAYLAVISNSRHFMWSGPSRTSAPLWPGRVLVAILPLLYGLILAVLILMAWARQWPYPQLLPGSLTLPSWGQLQGPLLLSTGLALLTTASAIGLGVLWFETIGQQRDTLLTSLSVAALGIPALVIGGGQYRLFLEAGLTGTFFGLALAHLTAVFAYVVIVLTGPYRAFDPKYRAVAYGLNAGHVRFWFKVKLPLLKAPLLTAAAVGFSVSMAQFVPAQLVAAGRFSTLPMEAVTLASGGSRSLTAAYALALTIMPALAFFGAHWFGRPRWS